MQNAFQLQSPLGQRGAQSFGMPSTSSMIDGSLTHQNLSFSHLPQSFRFNTMISSQGPPDLNRGHSSNTTSDRTPPSKDVTDESLDEAYVQFVLYCNPAIPASTDNFELKRGFRSAPRSDGKIFSTFELYKLILRLERKDIKTWSQVVIELGVELPDTSKNQSTQKVQQYAVRLKRWLHAYHIDAFFQYLMGTPNTYYTDIPGSDETPTGCQIVRDGVPPEEDLVIRALLPEWRPKRGRRKAEDVDPESNPPNKRLTQPRSSSVDLTQSFDEQFQVLQETPWSAQPPENDAWTAAQIALAPKTPSTGHTPSSGPLSADFGNQQFKFRINLADKLTPTSPYPKSATMLQQRSPMTPSVEDPKSAGPLSSTKSPSRSRKRHGPAVSSAWQGSNSGANGKLRGRPPSNRTVQEGPYSTFPANPNSKEAPTMSIGTPTPAIGSASSRNEDGITPGPTSGFQQLNSAASGQPSIVDQAAVRRPNKLQLQVPEHAGGPVRLATPPTVLINGEGRQTHERRSSADFFGSLDDESDDELDDEGDDTGSIDWKRRSQVLKRKLQEKEDELKALKRRVLDAVM